MDMKHARSGLAVLLAAAVITSAAALLAGCGPNSVGVPSGLGLTIARGLARVHGGGVTASNYPGGGASFVVTIPLESGAS